MRKTTQRIFTTTCALALAANSFTAFAQDKPQPKTQTPPTTQTQTIERGGVFVNTEGQTFEFKIADPVRGGFAGSGVGMPALAVAGQDGFSYSFMASEVGSTNKVVKGAPYSAEIVSEVVQTLADGNRITRRNTSNVARDGQGRTRREEVGPMALSDMAMAPTRPKTTIITDPVEGVTYMLDEKTHTARRMNIGSSGGNFTWTTRSDSGGENSVSVTSAGVATEKPKKINVSGGVLQGSAIKRVQPEYPSIAKASGASGAVQVQVTINENGDVIGAEVVSGHPLLREAALTAARQWKFKPTELGGQPVKVQGTLTFNFTLAGESNSNNNSATDGIAIREKVAAAGTRVNFVSTSLGKQMIEGVECEGTRRVSTIPVGQIGNERPIEIVFETWYSPELQITMLSKQSDPRMGETTIRVANLLRVEPDEYRFKVPSDYTIKDGGPVFMRTTKPE